MTDRLPALMYFLMDLLPIGKIQDAVEFARREPWTETKDRRPPARVALAEEMAKRVRGTE